MSEVIWKDIIKSHTQTYLQTLLEIAPAMEDADVKARLDETIKSCKTLLGVCEQSTLKERKPEILKENQGYWGISHTKYGTKISCDLKLPHSMMDQKAYNAYRMQVETLFAQHFVKNKHIGACFMVFIHHHKYQQCKDADNFEEKPLSDLIADYFIFGGDAYDHVQRMSLTRRSEHDYTQVYLVSPDQLVPFCQDIICNEQMYW